MEKLFIGFEMELPEGVMKEDIVGLSFMDDTERYGKVFVQIGTKDDTKEVETKWMSFIYNTDTDFVTLVNKDNDAQVQAFHCACVLDRRYRKEIKAGTYQPYFGNLFDRKELYAAAKCNKKETKKRSKRK